MKIGPVDVEIIGLKEIVKILYNVSQPRELINIRRNSASRLPVHQHVDRQIGRTRVGDYIGLESQLKSQGFLNPSACIAGATNTRCWFSGVHAHNEPEHQCKAIADSNFYHGAPWWVILSICNISVHFAWWVIVSKLASSSKPEVHNVSQRRRSRTEPRSQATWTEMRWFGHAVFEICSRRDRQTPSAQYSASISGAK